MSVSKIVKNVKFYLLKFYSTRKKSAFFAIFFGVVCELSTQKGGLEIYLT